MICAVRWVGAIAARSGIAGIMPKSLAARTSPRTGISSRLPGRSMSTVSTPRTSRIERVRRGEGRADLEWQRAAAQSPWRSAAGRRRRRSPSRSCPRSRPPGRGRWSSCRPRLSGWPRHDHGRDRVSQSWAGCYRLRRYGVCSRGAARQAREKRALHCPSVRHPARALKGGNIFPGHSPPRDLRAPAPRPTARAQRPRASPPPAPGTATSRLSRSPASRRLATAALAARVGWVSCCVAPG